MKRILAYGVLGYVALVGVLATPVLVTAQQTVRNVFVDVTVILGAAPSATNPLPVRITNGTSYASDEVAHDAVASGNPVPIGGRARSTAITAVASDDRTDAIYTTQGAALVSPQANTFGGCTPGSVISAGAVLETEIKGSAGQLYALSVSSLDATPVYLRVYDDTSAGLDEASDTPVMRYAIPEAAASGASGREIPLPATGVNFSTGIIFRVTTGIADNNTGALTASEVLVSYCYK
jgi:hypothetical protein